MNKIQFSIETNPHCCGIVNVGDFTFESQVFWGQQRQDMGKLTPDEVYEDFMHRLVEDIAGNGDWNGRYDGGVVLCQATLVSKSRIGGNRGLYAEIIELLQKHKWKTTNEFVNLNTGNTVVCLSKQISAKRIEKETDEDDW